MRIKPAQNIGQWHRWFAWHPVTLQDRTTVWLEYVQRYWAPIGLFGTWTYKK